MSDRSHLSSFMSLCGRYDFIEPTVTYRVVPYYFKEDELLPQEIHDFEKTVLGRFVDRDSIKFGQRCRVRPQIHLAKHLYSTLETDEISDSLQGRFRIWVSHKSGMDYDEAFESFLRFIDDNISKPHLVRTVDRYSELDQALQYRTFIFEKKAYVAVQPRLESKYLPPYQMPEIFKVKNMANFETFELSYKMECESGVYWYLTTHEFYRGGQHGFPTRTRWLDQDVVFEVFTGGGWVEAFPETNHLVVS